MSYPKYYLVFPEAADFSRCVVHYVNQDQKNEVDGYANQLKSEADYISSMKDDDN